MRSGCDVATVPLGVEHWHGASANSLFAHISLLESKPEGTDWGEPVSEDDYRKCLRRPRLVIRRPAPWAQN